MKNDQSLTQSIALVLASGGKCELWHPKRGDQNGSLGNVTRIGETFVMTRLGGKEMVWDWHYVKDCKIPLNSFDHLCRAVEADPVDNPAVRALIIAAKTPIESYGREEFTAHVEKLGPKRITIYDHEQGGNVFTIHSDWRIGGEFAFGIGPYMYLLREGYSVGIPSGHWIDRDELEATNG